MSKHVIMKLISAALLGGAAATPALAQEQAPTQLRSEDKAYSIFMLVRATPTWLALSPAERFAFLDKTVQPILLEHRAVEMRFWDTEHFNARVSDVILFETHDLRAYAMVVERLRETPFWGTYFEVVEVLPGIENAYAEAYGVDPY